jgi:DNA polymerase-1
VPADPTNDEKPGHPTLFLVDGYALIYRAFFAMLSRPLRTSRGENTSAAWGVVNFLQRLRTTHHPDYIVWVLDAGDSFRHEVYPEYKATREKLTEELQADFDQGLGRIDELLAAHRVPKIAVEGFEADDVIGTLAGQVTDAGLNVVIVSGDKDFQQLVRPGVWLLNPGRGGPAAVEENWVGIHNANDRLGVAPGFVTDYLALVGDSSDNVPGVPGIGDKTAKELVNTYGHLEAILEAAPGLKGKRAREALLEHPDRAQLSRKLVTIRTDVPVELDRKSLGVREPDVDALRALLVELEFTTLLRGVDQPAAVAQRAGTSASYEIVDDVTRLDDVAREVRAASRVALHVVTAPGPGSTAPLDSLQSRIIGLALAVRHGHAWYLPFGHRPWRPEQADLLDAQPPATRPRARTTAANAGLAAQLIEGDAPEPVNLPSLDSPALASIRALIEDAALPKLVHNAKFDLLVLRRAGINLAGLDFDPMLASYLLDPGRRSHSLELLSVEFLNQSMTSREDLLGRGKDAVPMSVVPVQAVANHAGAIVDVGLRMREVLEPQLQEHGLLSLLSEVELPLTAVLADMEDVGVSIDLDWFRSLKRRFRAECERIEQEVYAEAGSQFNLNSPHQLRVILFEKLGLPVRKRTATGPSTDASVLQELAEEGHQLPTLLMEYREVSKLESTYLDTLPELVHPRDGRLHTSFNQTVAATGRLSSSDPNLQNIPIRRELGRDIRRGFVAREGWQLIVADYSQVELRLLAHLSGDPAFVAAFSSGGDIHRQTAAVIFGIPLDDVTGEMRARAKTINFATIYGQGANALARQLKLTHAEARDFIATYFERFGGVRAYLDGQVEFAKQNGYVETIFHRRRYIPELKDRNFNVRAFGERVATNAPIQGSAADLIKVAMIRIHRALLDGGYQGRMILQVHDELVFEAPPAEVTVFRDLVCREMEGAVALKVPLVVDLGVGPNWLDAKA